MIVPNNEISKINLDFNVQFIIIIVEIGACIGVWLFGICSILLLYNDRKKAEFQINKSLKEMKIKMEGFVNNSTKVLTLEDENSLGGTMQPIK